MNNLEFYRKKKNISQRELGRQIGVSGAFISQLENNLNTPSTETLNKIAEVLEVDPDKLNLMNEENESYNPLHYNLITLLIKSTNKNLINWEVGSDEIFITYTTTVNHIHLILTVVVNENIEYGRSFIKEFVLEITDNDADKVYISSYFSNIIYDLLLKLYRSILEPVQTDLILSELVNELQDILTKAEKK